MNKIKCKKILSLILIAAMIMTFTVGCGSKDAVTDAVMDSTTDSATDSTTDSEAETKKFTFEVVDAEGTETVFNISSQKQTVGEALLDENLIEGTESEYGLYVTMVNGLEAIYEEDGSYWAFYINDEYAVTGVGSTDIEDGAKYSFKIEGN